MTYSQTIKPFGEVALSKKYITLDQLLHALNIQCLDDLENGDHKLIGTILHEQGAINQEQINEIAAYCSFRRVNATP